jgi:SIR2-like domain/TIR domain
MSSQKRFRVAFSFAGEKRDFVAQVAALLAARFTEAAILYDKYHEAEFARRDLGFYLPNLYRDQSDLVVVVVCRDYQQKEWCGLEWDAIFDLLKKRKNSEVMLCRFDHAMVQGLFSTAGFVELDDKTPEQATTRVLERLALNEGKPKDSYYADATLVSTTTPAHDPVDDAIAKILRLLMSTNVTYFLGPGSCYGRTDSLPRSCDITRELLAELELISPSYDQLLPPVDIAGMYYAVGSGDTNLETKVIEIISQSPGDIPATHRRLAALLQVLAQRPARRVRIPTQQLIVTTSQDIMMERALLSAGISFKRIVQHRSGKSIDVNEYREVRVDHDTVQLDSGAGPVKARLDCVEELDKIIGTCGKRCVDIGEPTVGSTNALDSLALQGCTGPILYKFLGSYDVPRSCTLSAEQHFEFAQRQNCIPAQITEIIANSPVLFLGHGFLDPDFRLASYTLLKKSSEIGTEPRYAVQLPPDRHPGDIYRQMESRIWAQIKECGSQQFRITTLELEGDLFLERLTSKLRIKLGISL